MRASRENVVRSQHHKNVVTLRKHGKFTQFKLFTDPQVEHNQIQTKARDSTPKAFGNNVIFEEPYEQE